jgi:hypothetical protein
METDLRIKHFVSVGHTYLELLREPKGPDAPLILAFSGKPPPGKVLEMVLPAFVAGAV